MSWFRCEVEGHERRLAHMRAHGLALDVDTAIDDLRVWQDRCLAPGSRLRFPSSGELSRRWGWPKTSAYRLIVDVERWSDPSRLVAWRSWWNGGDTIAERPRNDRGTTAPAGTPAMEETRNDAGTTPERPRNDDGHRRGDHPASSPSPVSLSGPLATWSAGDGLEAAAARACLRLLAADHLAPTTWRAGRGPALLTGPPLEQAQRATVDELVRQAAAVSPPVTPEEVDRVGWAGRHWPKPGELVAAVLRDRAEALQRRSLAAHDDLQLMLPEPLPLPPPAPVDPGPTVEPRRGRVEAPAQRAQSELGQWSAFREALERRRRGLEDPPVSAAAAGATHA